MSTIQQGWTSERVELLKKFFDAGLSCSQIACEIGTTRNAVIGKMHRLGLSRPKNLFAERIKPRRMPRDTWRPKALRRRAATTRARVRRSRWCCAMAWFCAFWKKCRRGVCGSWPMRWTGAHDDPDAGGDADLGGLRGDRHAARI